MSDLISRSAVLKVVKLVESIPSLPVNGADEIKVVYRGTFVCPMYHTETCLDDIDGFDDYNVDRTDDDGFCHLGERWEGEDA